MLIYEGAKLQGANLQQMSCAYKLMNTKSCTIYIEGAKMATNAILKYKALSYVCKVQYSYRRELSIHFAKCQATKQSTFLQYQVPYVKVWTFDHKSSNHKVQTFDS